MAEFDLGQFAQQFQQMGITDPFNQSNIAAAMSQITGQEVPASMVAQLTPEMLKAAQKGTYTPVVAGKAKNLLGELVAGLGGEKMQAAAGGFAGTVGTTTQETAARDVYGTKASGILGEVSKAQAAGQKNIQNIIASWKNIKGIQTGK